MDEQKPKLKLIGQDGNAFAILGLAQREAKRADWTKEKIEKFMSEAMSGDYSRLLATGTKPFDVL